jgi:PAS domain S-box-containing protein
VDVSPSEVVDRLQAALTKIGNSMLALTEVDELVEAAVEAVRDAPDWQAALDQLPVPIYTTDRSGSVTYWNKPCVEFAGRQPQLGEDKWCVTWELYSTTGRRILHEDCPMAEAIKRKCEVRDKVAVARRPDGTRRAFRPYPTPLFNESGDLTGAINVLIDVTEEQATALSDQVERCKRLALAVANKADSEMLAKLAQDFAATAEALRASNP